MSRDSNKTLFLIDANVALVLLLPAFTEKYYTIFSFEKFIFLVYGFLALISSVIFFIDRNTFDNYFKMNYDDTIMFKIFLYSRIMRFMCLICLLIIFFDVSMKNIYAMYILIIVCEAIYFCIFLGYVIYKVIFFVNSL